LVRLSDAPRQAGETTAPRTATGPATGTDPRTSTDPRTTPARHQAVFLGRGGDDGGWVRRTLEAGDTWLVCGPPGSGRSTALVAISTQLERAGWHVLDVRAPVPEHDRGTAIAIRPETSISTSAATGLSTAAGPGATTAPGQAAGP